MTRIVYFPGIISKFAMHFIVEEIDEDTLNGGASEDDACGPSLPDIGLFFTRWGFIQSGHCFSYLVNKTSLKVWP